MENIMKKTFKDYINEKAKGIELLTAIEDEVEQDLWGSDKNPLFYNGKDLFNVYMDNLGEIKDKIAEHFEDDNAGITDFQGQEVYLGYDKKKDEFVSGWDLWITEEVDNPDFDMDDEDSYEDEFIEESFTSNATVTFTISGSKIKVKNIGTGDNIFYSDKHLGYKKVEKNKNIVDIRLD